MARKKRRKRKVSVGAVLWMLLCTVAVIAIAAGVWYVVYFGQVTEEDRDVPDSIAGIAVHTDYISADSVARPGRKRAVHYIVIHETDNNGAHANARAHNQYLHENCWKEQKSWHFTVDDTEIWHHLPSNEVAYHAGDSSWQEGGNRNGIGIELCVNAGGDFDQTMQNAAQLTAYLLREYDLELDAVKKHQDFSGKNCPQTILTQNRWDAFLQMVQQACDTQAASQNSQE